MLALLTSAGEAVTSAGEGLYSEDGYNSVLAPAFALRRTFPSVSVALNQTRTSADTGVPNQVRAIQVVVNGSSWAGDTEIVLGIEISEDGLTWDSAREITATKSSLLNNTCHVGLDYQIASTNPNRLVRAYIRVTAGAPIAALDARVISA